jgi:hypothetical protein
MCTKHGTKFYTGLFTFGNQILMLKVRKYIKSDHTFQHCTESCGNLVGYILKFHTGMFTFSNRILMLKACRYIQCGHTFRHCTESCVNLVGYILIWYILMAYDLSILWHQDIVHAQHTRSYALAMLLAETISHRVRQYLKIYNGVKLKASLHD